MSDEDKDSKTEEPTEKKIRDTMEKGKLPVSKEVAIFTSFLAIMVYAIFAMTLYVLPPQG